LLSVQYRRKGKHNVLKNNNKTLEWSPRTNRGAASTKPRKCGRGKVRKVQTELTIDPGRGRGKDDPNLVYDRRNGMDPNTATNTDDMDSRQDLDCEHRT